MFCVSKKLQLSNVLATSQSERSFQERKFEVIQSRNVTILHQVNNVDFEERIMQHLAAAAAMQRSRAGRREGSWTRSSAHDRQQSTNQSPVSSPTASQRFTNDNSLPHQMEQDLRKPSCLSQRCGDLISVRNFNAVQRVDFKMCKRIEGDAVFTKPFCDGYWFRS
ncbi:hypothetical protein OROHE_010486 [Orobanche hederae]